MIIVEGYDCTWSVGFIAHYDFYFSDLILIRVVSYITAAWCTAVVLARRHPIATTRATLL